jgi:hypothetical protein
MRVYVSACVCTVFLKKNPSLRMLIFVSRRGVDFLFLFWKGFGTFLVWFFLRYLGFCLSCRFFGFGEVLLTICSRFCGSGFSVLEKVYFRYFPVLRISLF